MFVPFWAHDRGKAVLKRRVPTLNLALSVAAPSPEQEDMP